MYAVTRKGELPDLVVERKYEVAGWVLLKGYVTLESMEPWWVTSGGVHYPLKVFLKSRGYDSLKHHIEMGERYPRLCHYVKMGAKASQLKALLESSC